MIQHNDLLQYVEYLGVECADLVEYVNASKCVLGIKYFVTVSFHPLTEAAFIESFIFHKPFQETVYEYYVDPKNKTWISFEDQLPKGWRYNAA